MTTTEYLQREIRRTELSIRRAERKPNTPDEELRGLHEKLEHLQEALEAVNEHWQRVHENLEHLQVALEQLREMDGEPVWIEDVKHWALIDIEKGGQWDGVPFAVWAENGVKFTYNVESRDLHCYRRPPEGEEDSNV